MEGEEVEKARAMVQPMHLDHSLFRSCSQVDPNSAMWSLNSSTEWTEGTWTNSKEGTWTNSQKGVVGCDLWVPTSSECCSWIRHQWTCCSAATRKATPVSVLCWEQTPVLEPHPLCAATGAESRVMQKETAHLNFLSLFIVLFKGTQHFSWKGTILKLLGGIRKVHGRFPSHLQIQVLM